jgi:hypothetical protein
MSYTENKIRKEIKCNIEVDYYELKYKKTKNMKIEKLKNVDVMKIK